MGCLEGIFSEDNLISYSKACLNLALDIPIRFKEKGLDTLVIPSRGAVPFFLGMMYALGKFAENNLAQEHVDFYNNLGIQKSLLPLIPKDSGRTRGELENKPVRVLLAPFTADLNLAKFDSNENTDEYVEKTRQYWAHVTAAMFEGPETRRKNPYFRSFVDVILRDIEKRENIAKSYESFPKINKFGIMDTVISGRASNHILKAFEEIAKKKGNPSFNPDAFLIVDEDGRKLKKEFNDYLAAKEREARLSRYNVSRIVSEDENASLLGVGAVAYPSVMRASKGLVYGMKEFFVGAGSWRLDKELGENNPHIANFHRFMNLIKSGIDFSFAVGYEGNSNQEEKSEKFSKEWQGFIDNAYQNNLITKGADISHVLKEIKYHPEHVYETHSFVMHIPFSEASTAKIISKLTEIEGVKKSGKGTQFISPNEIRRKKRLNSKE